MWTWGKSLFNWVIGERSRMVRLAGTAALFGLYYAFQDVFKSWFQGLHLLMPEGLMINLEQFLPYWKAANYWVPLKEALTMYMAYRTWQLSLMCIRLVKWVVGM